MKQIKKKNNYNKNFFISKDYQEIGDYYFKFLDPTFSQLLIIDIVEIVEKNYIFFKKQKFAEKCEEMRNILFLIKELGVDFQKK